MCPSRSKLARRFGNLIAVLLLAACSSVPKNENVDGKEKEVDSSVTSPDNQSEIATAENGLVAYQGPDPMADIQINAEIKKVYRDVAKLNLDKKYQQALNLLNSVKTKYPQLSGPDYQIARIYFSEKKFDEALAAVDLSLASNARNYFSLNLKGIILREKGDFQRSKDAYLAAIEAYPPYPKSHLNLGVLADIYLRDSALALVQYKQYQTLSKDADKTVANWIIEIERRIKAGG